MAADVSIWDDHVLRVFGFVRLERADPVLRPGQTLVPVVEGGVLEVSVRLVRAHGEGGGHHCQGVPVQQRRVVVHGTQHPPQDVVGYGEDPEEPDGQAGLLEVVL